MNEAMSVEEAIVLLKNEIDMQKGIGIVGSISDFVDQSDLQNALNSILKRTGNLSPDESRKIIDLLEKEKRQRAKADARKTVVTMVIVGIGLLTAGYFIYKKYKK